MLDLTVIILTYNEEVHIRRCLEDVWPVAQKVIVVDSPSTDKMLEICHEFENVEVAVHKYPGNQAEQFNWALVNLKVETEWVLRLDADEYLMPELIDELKAKLPNMDKGVSALSLSRALSAERYFITVLSTVFGLPASSAQGRRDMRIDLWTNTCR